MTENLIFLSILNIFFFLFHGIIILINVFGWTIWRFRHLHYTVLGATLFSWLVMGYFFGWGYCFLTDWHYGILGQLGYRDLPNSYIKFCLDAILETDLDPLWVDVGTVSGLIFGMVGAGYNIAVRKK